MTEEFRKFLKSLYDKLYKEGIITKKASTSKEKLEIVLAYIEKISQVQNKSLEKEEYLKRIKKLYYKRYIIKESEIPNSYFEFLSKKYLEEGKGHLNLLNPETNLEKETRKMHVEEIIHTEMSSIDAWLNYLMSKESDYIPTWAKVWAFMGMLDIGTINKESGNFNRRSKETIAPFVNINSEILGKSVEYLKMHLKLIPEEYPDEDIKRLASSESFYQIYGKILAKIASIKINGNDGIWVKYKEKSEEDALKLYESLQGYNTGWCTASSKETAINQVCGGGSYPGGDFYVYYSKDQNNEYKLPRLAIRMNQNKIGEIRGIASNQNIESEMEEILEEKLKEFPDGNEYKKKVSDMRELTKIYGKYQNNQELTKENLRFLYEIDSKIEGFGYQTDPRIEEIIGKRNKRKDLANIFDCKEEEIGINPESIEGKKIVYYYGDLDLSNLISAKDLVLPQSIGGSLWLNGLTSAEGLVLPQSIGEDLWLNGLTSAKDLALPRSIGGSLWLNGLTSAEGLVLPQSIGGSLRLNGLTSAEGLVLPQSIGGDLSLDALTKAEGLVLPLSIGGSLSLDSLTSAEGLVLPQSIVGDLSLDALTKAEGLVLPQSIEGSLLLNGLTSAECLVLPQSIGVSLLLNGLTSAEGLVLPQSIGRSLWLNGLTSAEGLVLPKSIGEELWLNGLTIDDLLNIELPNSVSDIYLGDGTYSLEELKNLIAVKREKLDLQAKRYIIQSSPTIDDNLKRGNINIWYILIPAFTLLLGIVIATFIYY